MSEKRRTLSNQLYESCINSAAHGICTIDEYPSGYVEISTYRGNNASEELNVSTFSLPPSQSGVAEAEGIIKSLTLWVEKIRGKNVVQEVVQEIPVEFT